MTDIAHVACGACRACCRNQLVPLQDGERPEDFDVDTHQTPYGTLHVLKRQPNGDCVYLADEGCTIWGRHPVVCRVFDCAAAWLSINRTRRRALGMKAKADPVLMAGREHATG